MEKKLGTEPYKGTRDFYPRDAAIQRYIFDTWAKTAESFGYERYDASVLEPSELYRSKGAENAELVNEQTYTFIDRGEREVTLRPEMTPTVARMIASKRRDLSFPVRWYSIPNLFRYERPQRGRLREHWQLNCDLFGIDSVAADVEMISLAYHVLTEFGAHTDDFVIHINSRKVQNAVYAAHGLTSEQIRDTNALIDRKKKMPAEEFTAKLKVIAGPEFVLPETEPEEIVAIREGLRTLGITNTIYDTSIVRGFNYYTGTVFELFDTDKENTRSLIGGGRYDNLTSLFSEDPVSGIGFGMGDVTMRDFLETHGLLDGRVKTTAPTVVVIPMESVYSLEGERIAQEFRTAGVSASVDFGERKLGKKISSAGENGSTYVLVLGETEHTTKKYTLKRLADGTEQSGSLEVLVKSVQ